MIKIVIAFVPVNSFCVYLITEKAFLLLLCDPSLFPYLPFDNVSQALYELKTWEKFYCLSIETLNVFKELFYFLENILSIFKTFTRMFS